MEGSFRARTFKADGDHDDDRGNDQDGVVAVCARQVILLFLAQCRKRHVLRGIACGRHQRMCRNHDCKLQMQRCLRACREMGVSLRGEKQEKGLRVESVVMCARQCQSLRWRLAGGKDSRGKRKGINNGDTGGGGGSGGGGSPVVQRDRWARGRPVLSHCSRFASAIRATAAATRAAARTQDPRAPGALAKVEVHAFAICAAACRPGMASGCPPLSQFAMSTRRLRGSRPPNPPQQGNIC